MRNPRGFAVQIWCTDPRVILRCGVVSESGQRRRTEHEAVEETDVLCTLRNRTANATRALQVVEAGINENDGPRNHSPHLSMVFHAGWE